MQSFSIGTALKTGWEKFKSHWTIYVSIMVVFVALSFLSNKLQRPGDVVFSEAFDFLLSVAILVVNMIISMGIIRVSLDVLDNKPVKLTDVFSQIQNFPRYFGANIVVAVITFAGLILLIVPGIIWALKYGMTQYIILDRKLSIIESIKESGKLTEGHKWQLFFFLLVAIGFNILGALAFGLGVIITIPITWIAGAYIYRWLEMKGKEMVTATPEPPLDPASSSAL